MTDKWRGMETAPKDGTNILAFYNEGAQMRVIWWAAETGRGFWEQVGSATKLEWVPLPDDGYWEGGDGGLPDYWMPLPASPSPEG
jgi:hypothetical protein